MLILYPATLLNQFISSNSFLCMASLGFSKYKIIASANKNNLTYSFPIWMPFISFSCLIVLARISKTMLINSDKSGYPCYVQDLRGGSQFSPMQYETSCGSVIGVEECL